MSHESPCLTCGACCAFFRVSFHWSEAVSGGGTVPDNLTHTINQHLSCMSGTQGKPPRCTSLLGDVGSAVRCTIYENRSTTCREFNTHDINGLPEDACTRARAAYGMAPLEVIYKTQDAG